MGLFVVGQGRGKLGMVQTQERRKEPAERIHSGVLRLEFGVPRISYKKHKSSVAGIAGHYRWLQRMGAAD